MYFFFYANIHFIYRFPKRVTYVIVSYKIMVFKFIPLIKNLLIFWSLLFLNKGAKMNIL